MLLSVVRYALCLYDFTFYFYTSGPSYKGFIILIMFKETAQFIKLCQDDMYRRPKTAKISLGLNHRVTFGSRSYVTSHSVKRVN